MPTTPPMTGEQIASATGDYPAAGMEGPAVERDEPWSFVRVDLPCIVAALVIWCATWIAIGALS